MKVTIISGGTGSKQLKEGLLNYIKPENLFILTNLLDNGKSTGLARQIFNGDIPGPSDARKNILHNYELINKGKDLELDNVYNILNKRYTFYTDPKHNFKQLCSNFKPKTKKIFIDAINTFFNQPLANNIKYVDFSFGNIILSSLMYKYGVQKGIDILEDILKLPRTVIVNSEDNVFLGAVTESGYYIYDEGSIVDWDNPNDKIVDIFTIDKYGKNVKQILSKQAKNILEKSDLIIFSSGTQFSSLIPTYVTENFIDTIKNKNIILVKNANQDKDMTGYSDDEEIRKIHGYISEIKYSIISHKELKIENIPVYVRPIVSENLHKSADLAYYILDIYFDLNEFKKCIPDNIFFDYDDTIYSRSKSDIEISLENVNYVKELNGNILTGKTKDELVDNIQDLNIYASYGCAYYKNKKFIKSINRIDNKLLIKITDTLKKVKFNFSMFENRNDCVISLRYLDKDYRNVLYEYLKSVLPSELHIRKGGTSTIDIMLKDTNKYTSLKKHGITQDIIFLGDEDDGNDACLIGQKNIKFIKVDVYKTNVFLKYVQEYIKRRVLA